MTTDDITLTSDGKRFDIYIPGKPIAQPRPKVGKVNGFTRAYVDAKHPVHAFRLAVQAAWWDAGAIVVNGPLLVDIELVFKRPQAKCWKTLPTPRYPHTSKPDADNAAKAILDALDGKAFANDSAVCQLRVAKWVAAGDEQPGTRVSVIELGTI